MFRKFSPFAFMAFLFLTHLCLFFVFRLVLFYFVYPQITDHDAILEALYIGLKFDARYVIFLILIPCLCLIVPPLERKLTRSAIFRSTVLFVQTGMFFAILFVYIVDLIVYFYLNQRVDLTLLDLMREADIGFAMVWQSYPVVRIALAVMLVLAGYWYFWNAMYQKHVPLPVRKLKQPKGLEESSSFGFAVCLRFCLLFLMFILGYGQISSNLFPLRWSNAYFSVDKNIPLIALNPVQNLYDTRKALDFVIPDEKFAFASFDRMKALLGVPEENKAVDFSRYAAGDKNQKPLNVVIIMMESWTTPKTSLPHGRGSKQGFVDHENYPQEYDINPTPFSEELLKTSLYYPNFYANARTTARGILSTLTGITDVNFVGSTTSRNPKMVDQHIIFNEFKNYERYYMIGGNANWANIRGVFQNNIDNLHLLEESDWKSPNVDVWGISDLALFKESVDVLSKSKKPFVAFIQTAGYHRPFTIPSDNDGFELAPAPSEDVLKTWGFAGVEEYQALRFVDHALMRFFEKAKQTDWYEDTVFILFGDHGTIEFNGTMTKSYLASLSQFWHIPFFIHCPKYIPAGINPALHSQADIFPTAGQIAGIGYLNTTLGSPMLKKLPDGTFIPREFEVAEKNGRREYVYSKALDEAYGNYVYIAESEGKNILRKDNFVFLSSINDSKGKFDVLYDVANDEAQNLKNEYPELAESMRQISDDFYYTCKYLLLNNQKSRYPRK